MSLASLIAERRGYHDSPCSESQYAPAVMQVVETFRQDILWDHKREI
jgi:hypothetical protein